jgi:hypothetical protein
MILSFLHILHKIGLQSYTVCHCNYVVDLLHIIFIFLYFFSCVTSAFLFGVIDMDRKLLIMNERVVFRRKRSEIHKRFLLNHIRLEITWKHLA